MAGLRLRFRSREYDFRPYGSERKDEIDKAWKLLHSVAEKVGAQLEWDEASDTHFEGDLGESGWIALRSGTRCSARGSIIDAGSGKRPPC